MMKPNCRYTLLGVNVSLCVVLALLAVAWIPAMSPSAQVILRVPQDYPTIQAAIDAAPEGAIILIISPPQYEENIVINKSVTLRGAAFTAFIRGAEPLWPVIRIASDTPIQVTLENLDISQGESSDVVQIAGQARVTFNRVYVAYYYGYSGIVVEGLAHLILRDSIISGFSGTGLTVYHNATVELINSQISGTHNDGIGLITGGPVRVMLQHSTISGHSGGIVINYPALAILRDSVVVGNKVGISVHNNFMILPDHPMVILENVQVAGNRKAGLYIETGTAEFRRSLIFGNGMDPKCQKLPLQETCSGSGIMLTGNGAKIKFFSTEIRHNAMWGLAVYLPQCGGSPPPTSFDDRVVFGDDKNVIEGNNISGRLSGMGNPGNHPFKNLPDGQVCLP
jgi:hypothetical protein